ncbi:MAG: hypothetical protein KKD21_15860 [Proteobacteria bacterium]|nr:hypothetical protein [Pseudomonadota bacterium]MBU1698491.1 hypothetical protein [Pseudomonadota bacterium]
MKKILCIIDNIGKFPFAGYKDTLSLLLRLNKEYNKSNKVSVSFVTISKEIKIGLKRYNLELEIINLEEVSEKECFDDVSFIETKWPKIREDYFCNLYFPETSLLISSVSFYDRLWPVMTGAWKFYESIRNFIERQRYNLLVCIGDGVISKHLLCDAKRKHVFSIGVAFGLLREKRLIDSIFLYDYIFVRQKEDKNFLANAKGVSRERIGVLGDYYFEKYLPYLRRKLLKEREMLYKKLGMNNKTKLIIVPFYGDQQWDIKRILEVLQLLIEEEREVKVIIKCHPYSKNEVLFCQKYYDSIIGGKRGFHIIRSECTIHELLSVTKVVVTPKYSLIVEESLTFQVPVVIMDYRDINYTSKMECQNRDGVFIVNEISELPAQLRKLFSSSCDFKVKWQSIPDKEGRLISKVKDFLAK